MCKPIRIGPCLPKITYCTLIYKNRAKNRAVLNSKIAPKIAARILARIFHFLGKIAARDFFSRGAIFSDFGQKSRRAKKNQTAKGMEK